MTQILDQPPPIATDRRPTWDIVIEYIEKQQQLGGIGDTAVVQHLLVHMRERDEVGHARYGVRLTSGNGRDHLVDATQEILDAIVYLANDLDEHGIGPDTDLGGLGGTTGRYLSAVQQLFVSQVRAAIQLCALIEERAS